MFKDSRKECGPDHTKTSKQPTEVAESVFCKCQDDHFLATSAWLFEVHLEILIAADKKSSSIHYRTL